MGEGVGAGRGAGRGGREEAVACGEENVGVQGVGSRSMHGRRWTKVRDGGKGVYSEEREEGEVEEPS